jgi:cleavage stimulation factor subunit 1
MISQLRYDGYETVATNLARNFSAYPPSSPSSRLSHLVSLGLQMEGEASKPDSVDMLPHIRGRGVMDLEYENDENILAPPAHRHDIGYVTSHKGPILCANFSHDGTSLHSLLYYVLFN